MVYELISQIILTHILLCRKLEILASRTSPKWISTNTKPNQVNLRKSQSLPSLNWFPIILFR